MPEPRQLVLRDDLAAPDDFAWPVPAGATLLVAVPRQPDDAEPDDAEPDDAEPVGVAVLAGDVPVLGLEQLWVRSEHRGQGFGRRIVELVQAHAVAAGALVLTARVPRGQAVLTALAGRAKVLGEYMMKGPLSARPLPTRFGWRRLTPGEYGTWYETQVRAYAEENLARAGGDPVGALERSRAEFAEVLPDGLETLDASLMVLTVEDVRVGHLWLAHHRRRGETFGFDLEIDPGRRREGWARAAIALAERLTIEAGDHSLGLHVFEQKAGARRLYESEGFVGRVTTYDRLARG